MLVIYQLKLQDTQNFLPKTYDAQLVMKITSQWTNAQLTCSFEDATCIKKYTIYST